MCGICGNLNLTKLHPIDTNQLKRMVTIMRHRGPDEFGIYRDKDIGLGHARLSIIDLKGGQQPMHNEDKSIWLILNGEIFNYIELREELVAKGHKFYTRSDTEVLIHLYEEKGIDMFSQLNGQFAFALWDLKNKRLLLARDRVGIRPLFYTTIDGSLLFASEIKSIFEDKRVSRQLDVSGLDQLFTFWANIPPQTVFKGINELPPAHYLIAEKDSLTIKRYWELDFSSPDNGSINEDAYADQLLELLKDSIRIRLRADVPVAAYLSGGLDSSIITALVKKHFKNKLQTFSVSFKDKDYDESSFQRQMADFLATEHKGVDCGYADIGRLMPEVVWHAEKPLIRTAPAPLFQLAKLVRKNNIKVVLTGEGADEVLGGYDLFREAKIRRFWAKNPDSRMRPLLIRQLYSYIPNWPKTTSAFLEGFYRNHLQETSSKCYSHLPRWEITSKIKSLFSQDVKNELIGRNAIQDFENIFPGKFSSWDHLAQAQYIEIATLLSGNLLSSQGDRMMMANSVEGRFPFLDYRVVEFCAKLPASLKLKVMDEKYLLKKIAQPYVPEEICKRKKQGYRAPDSASFFNGRRHSYIDDLLSEEHLSKTNIFDPELVASLVKKCKTTDKTLISAKDNMAIVGIITTLLLDKQFLTKGHKHEDLYQMHTA
ncbi:MAG: asparagine synthase (glutamine-hydrolyzing) [Prolixibacteraceae bacterium]|nr:asparagine synthase (glutamine-hydrolyzing) [Prolixibacteraceae bacterium]